MKKLEIATIGLAVGIAVFLSVNALLGTHFWWWLTNCGPNEGGPYKTEPVTVQLVPIENCVQERIYTLENEYNPDQILPWHKSENVVVIDLMKESGENRYYPFLRATLVKEENDWVVENEVRN